MYSVVPIGVIHTPYGTLEECPRNIAMDGEVCTLKLAPEYCDGLLGLDTHDYIEVLYWLDKADRTPLIQNRRSDGKRMGTFAIRSPNRPNPIGSAVVKLLGLEGDEVRVLGLDCLDGTPLLDIKPAMRGQL